MKKNWILILTGLLFNLNLLGQNPDLDYQKYIFDSLAVINDKDGYTNVRENPDLSSKIIFQIKTNFIFKITANSKSSWKEIEQFGLKNRTGFIHESRIKNLGSLSNNEMRELSKLILDSTIILMNDLHSLNQEGMYDTTKHRDLHKEFSVYYHFQMYPALKLVSKYYCNTQDRKFLNYYLDFLVETKGTAWEATSFAIGEIFGCDSENVIKEIYKRSNFEKEILKNDLEWGIQGEPNENELKLKIEFIEIE
ncbi:MAG: hypothetical protein DRJ01_15360 [Bacteroidetes bacterium]|nr:MAG: hypothetical protein DRJ01_15360 [Bacteroidota bacterium]